MESTKEHVLLVTRDNRPVFRTKKSTLWVKCSDERIVRTRELKAPSC